MRVQLYLSLHFYLLYLLLNISPDLCPPNYLSAIPAAVTSDLKQRFIDT